MAYVSGFSNDIFVSYASVDNEPDAQDVRLVSRFRGDLETALRRRLGKDVEIFFDQAGLRAYDDLEQLLKNARASAIFLAVFSPSYAEREWTLEELKAFHAVAKASGEANRIVTIEILPVEASRFPPEIEHLKRTRFYTQDKDSGTDFPLTSASQPALYNERVQQLAHHLVLLLRDMRQQRESETPAQPDRVAPAPAVAAKIPAAALAMEPARTVLLAQVTDDVYDERQKVAAYLERADLFVQLLGRARSPKPEDLRAEGEPARSYAQFQYDAARRRGIPILQWRHPDVSPDKLSPSNWDRQLLDGADVRVMGLQEFMKEIRTVVGRLNQKQEAKPARGDFIFINADRSDQELAQTLFKALNDNNCYAVVPMNDGSASAKEIEEDLEANLLDCRGLLLVYGKSSLAWVRAQIRRFIKLEDRRQAPLRLKTILCGPPPAKPDVGVSGFELIDCQDGATAERVQRIIRELQL